MDKNNKSNLGGVKYAIEGIVHVFRTQKHMRFHFLSVIIAGIFCLLLRLNYLEIIAVVFAISFVLFAELMNTAVETVVDMVTQKYHPLAKFAKDIAAGAVLVASMNAIVIGIIIVFNKNRILKISEVTNWDKPDIVVIGTIVAIIMLALIIMYKVAGNKGKIWKGGVISIHSAVGFFIAWTALFIDNRVAIAVIALVLASLIAQSRVEGGIHTLSEVIWGAVIATIMAFLGYLVFAPLF